nr:MAG TPA: hypothetical protein [Caudoviricetes sp.]
MPRLGKVEVLREDKVYIGIIIQSFYIGKEIIYLLYINRLFRNISC